MLDLTLAADREADPIPSPVAGPLLTADDRVLAARVERCRRAFLEQGSDTARAGLQVVDLRRLRQALGPRWPALRDRVLGVIEGTLARALGVFDLCVAGGEDQIYLLRVGADRAELARHSQLLAAEATTRLCGTIPGGAAIRVLTYAFDLDQSLADVTTAAELRARIERGIEPPQSGGSAALGHRLQPRFRPLLNPRKRLVSAYRLAGFVSGGDVPAPFRLTRLSDVDDEAAAELDQWSLKQALHALIPAPARAAAALVVSLHYHTLASMRRREGYVGLCRQLPPDSGRRLIFELLELPAWLQQARVRELMAYLRPFCGAIIVRLRTTSTNIEHLVATGVRGLSLADLPAAPDAAAQGTCLEELGALARANAMRSLAVELASPGDARKAIAAGIDHIGGDALLPPLSRLERPFLLSSHH